MRLKIAQLQRSSLIALILISAIPLQVLAQETADQASESGVVAPTEGGGGGNMNFQADLFTGRFTYAVPIKAAPGRQGAQPKLTLGYNSASGNGWCGMGWSLDVGYIQRDTRMGVPISWSEVYNVLFGHTNYLGRTLPQSNYDDSRGFIANIGGVGSELVLVGPTNQNPIVYRQQVDTSFLIYNYYTNNHWEVVDKSGNTFFFGEGPTNQMQNPKSGWTANTGQSTFRWALNKVIDVNGNATYLKYTSDGGMLYLTNISYNANINSPALAATHTIDFILANRSDTNISFTSGYRVQTKKRLSEIDLKVSGANVSKYVLGYTQSPSTKRSLLTSVTTYGSDYSTALPPLTFNYQVKPFSFGSATNWPGLYSQSETDAGWNSIRGVNNSGDTFIGMYDIDGDALPDRVMRSDNAPYDRFWVQRNTGSGFTYTDHSYLWGPLASNGHTDNGWNSPTTINTTHNTTTTDMVDMNGDGYPDRVLHNDTSPFTNFFVEFNSGKASGSSGFSGDISWGLVDNTKTSDENWLCPDYKSAVGLIDINGDGLPDRVSRMYSSPFDKFEVQFNTGNGFSMPGYWSPLDSQGDTSSDWNSLSLIGASTPDQYVILMDINGDGLPDRVMRQINSPYTKFIVQFNNGAGFEPAEDWGPVDSQGHTNSNDWGSPIGTGGSQVWATLADINGDGLPDRVMRHDAAPYTSDWIVQLNTGSGFAATTNWGPLDSQGQTSDDWNDISDKNSGNTDVDFFDINGDGLPDRVMETVSTPHDHFVVQLNKGPFPDLLCTQSNGLGGTMQVSYVASTTLDNRDTNWVSDPWAGGTKSLLPFNVWVVSKISTADGMGNSITNTYAFKGGYYNAAEREFRGFSQATVTDPLGTKTVTYFHQSGGRDNTALGEYLDKGSESKKGIPFRIEVIGSDGATNSITLNKVQEAVLNTNGWYFPFISQNIVMTYEGLNSYRAKAKQFNYDTNNGNLLLAIDLGEVTNVVFSSQTNTDIASDSVYTWISYTNFSKPADIKITSDSAGANRLRETLMSYDSRGNVIGSQTWLDTAGTYITTVSTSYDQYGNPVQGTDAAGIVTTTIYDSIYQQYPVTQITGTFTNQLITDARSGLTVEAIDVKGLVTSNVFDVFYRSAVTYISTNSYGAPTLWKTKSSYSMGGIVSGTSSNFVRQQVNDAVDTANGFETYTYLDGMGRTIQTRTEAETGQFRVANACYDKRGNAYFQTLPYFSSGAAFTSISSTYLGTLTEYDNIGRAYRTTPAVQGSFSAGSLTSTSTTGGDSGSPIGATTTAFVDGSNPWAIVVTDSEGKVKKSYRDAHGQTITITEVTSGGNYNTTYKYDLLGNLTNVTDNANNGTVMAYDSLGRKTFMTDLDMGKWSYTYDNPGRMTQQIDARTNKLTFTYSDQHGRLTSKQIYNSANALVGTITYTYDTSGGDTNYTVFNGQLYKVTDLQGCQRSSYDVRGRVVKTGRFLNVNSMEYVTQSVYDDADRILQITYPGNSAIIKYGYDTGGNLIQVKSLAGTGTQEILYTPQGGFNALGQLLGYTNGNGVMTTNIYFANSKRLQRVQVKGASTLQDLAYTYDTISNLKSISDGVYSNSASASISGIAYDDLYRVTTVNSTARGSKTYAYDSIGNILTNQDFGSGPYGYGTRPHAVTSANGTNGTIYAYDACGNMITRGSQTLAYDEQNELIQVSATNTLVKFGYDGGGQRLWRSGTNGYSVWIGGIYEINNGKVLCHVFAGGKRLATFEPQCGGLWSSVVGDNNWYAASTAIQSIFNWPFQKGRGQMTLFVGTWAGIFGICLLGGRRIRLERRAIRKIFSLAFLGRQATTVIIISAFLWISTGKVEAATYNPVFYYYHNDNLGSSSVLTDRSGSMVQHYECSTFGQSSYQNNSSAYQVSNRYTGQICDDETGLYYYNARYYDPQLGRFIEPDTMVPGASDSQNLNRYSYVNNNPINQTDPSGHGFFSGLWKSFSAPFVNMFKNPFSYSNITGSLTGPLVAGQFAAEDYINAQIFGKNIGADISTARSAAMGVATIVVGIALCFVPGGQVAGAFMITSGALSLSSLGASLAGNERLSEDFGWAAFGVGVAAGVYQLGQAWAASEQSNPSGSLVTNQDDAGGSGSQPESASDHDPFAFQKKPATGVDTVKQAGGSLAKGWWLNGGRELIMDFYRSLNTYVRVVIGAAVTIASYFLQMKVSITEFSSNIWGHIVTIGLWIQKEDGNNIMPRGGIYGTIKF